MIGGAGGVVLSAGQQTLSGVNTYTGATRIAGGATLALSESGSVASSSGVTADGTFDITGTTQGASIQTLSGSGEVRTAADKDLTLTNASGMFSGVIGGAGGVVLSAGREILNGVNTYTGGTVVNSGTLIVGERSDLSNASIAGNTAVLPGATLGGHGIVTSAGRTLNNTGTVSPGNSIGTLTVGGNYVQGSNGNLAIEVTPTANDKLAVAGTASLAGTVTVTGSPGNYVPTRYTLLSSAARSGQFDALVSDLGSYTSLGYFLSYDAYNAYLTLGPDAINTTTALHTNLEQIRSLFASQAGLQISGLNYDCSSFDENNICVSGGGRASYVHNDDDQFSGSRPLTTSALLIGAYRFNPAFRLGGWVDQNLHVQTEHVKMSNSKPMLGAFGIYNPARDGAQWKFGAALSYVDKDMKIARQRLENTEEAYGRTSFKGLAGQIELSYGFQNVVSNALLSPFFGVRGYRGKVDGYTEKSSASVQVPITYGDYKQWSKTVFGGLRLEGVLRKEFKYNLAAGVESDFDNNTPRYSGTSRIYGLDAFALKGSSRPRDVRGFASAHASYEVRKNESINFGIYYRQDYLKDLDSVSAMLTYTIGL